MDERIEKIVIGLNEETAELKDLTERINDSCTKLNNIAVSFEQLIKESPELLDVILDEENDVSFFDYVGEAVECLDEINVDVDDIYNQIESLGDDIIRYRNGKWYWLYKLTYTEWR